MKTTTPEPTQRLNVDLPKSQYFALKSYALHNDISVSQLVRDSLQDIVDYDTWFKARVQTAVNDPRPAIEPAAWDKIRAAKLAKRGASKATG
jgi:hypothetical protein